MISTVTLLLLSDIAFAAGAPIILTAGTCIPARCLGIAPDGRRVTLPHGAPVRRVHRTGAVTLLTVTADPRGERMPPASPAWSALQALDGGAR